MLAARLIKANPDSSFSVEPLPIPPLTNLNSSVNGLEIPPSPNLAGQSFEVDIHLLNGAGVSGIEVHFYFGNMLSYAVPTGFTDMLGQQGGVLTGPSSRLLSTITAGLYDASGKPVPSPPYTGAVYYKVASASMAGDWNGADGLVAKITFQIIQQPTSSVGNQYFPLVMDFTDIVESAATGSNIQGSLQIDADLFAYPERANICVSPPTIQAVKYGDMFQIDVNISADAFWDVVGFDVTFTYNPTLLTLVSFDLGHFLVQHGEAVFGVNDASATGMVHAVYTKLADPSPSSGNDTLMVLTFRASAISTTYSPFSSVFGLMNTDLASWAHPELPIAPWFGSNTAVDLPEDNRAVPLALAWSHTTTNGTYTDQNAVNNTMPIQAGGLAQVTGITVNNAPYVKYSGTMMNFTVTLRTISEQTLAQRGWPNATLSIDVFDSSGYPIGEVLMNIAGINATRVDVNGIGGTTGGVYTYTVTMPLPTWARVGAATVTGFALTDMPTNGGVPLGPQLPGVIFSIETTP